MTINKESGLTESEQKVADGILKVYSDYQILDFQHPDELHDVAEAVHIIQDLLACRIARREFPNYWKTYKVEGKNVE